MRPLALACALLIGCGGDPASPRPSREMEGPPPAPSAPTVSASCDLHASPVEAPALADDLREVAPQYFHSGHRGGFDAYHGGPPVFPWFDVFDLEHAVTPPRNVRVAASTPSALFVVRDGAMGVLARGASDVHWTAHELYPEEAVEHGDERWVLARDTHTWKVFRASDERAVSTEIDVRRWDVRLAVAADGTPVLAWVDREGEHLRVHVAWDLDVEHARVVDDVTLPEPVAELSLITRSGLAVAADGEHGIGLAWRPLSDPDLDDVGSPGAPPQTPSAAQVRWMVVAPDGARSEVRTHATIAQPLGGTTGIGPWPLSGNGMKAGRLGARAVFVWNDGEAIRGVTTDMDHAVELTSAEGAPLIALRERELLLFDTTPRVRALRLSCE